MNKNSSNYAPSEQDKFFVLTPGPNPSSSVAGSSSSGLRPHGGLLAPLPGTPHPSATGLPIQQQRGSITSGIPIQLRPPASTSYLTTIPPSQVISGIQ